MINVLKNKIVKLIDRRVNQILDEKFKEYYHSEVWENGKRKGNVKLLKLLPNGMYFYCHFDSVLEKMIYVESFEKDEIHLINSYLKEGDQFIDIGAHTGLHTVYAAKKVGDSGKVYSFEPTISSFQRLNGNIELNKLNNVESFNMAVSKKNGKLKFYTIDEGYEAWNSLAKPFIRKKYSTTEVTAIQIDKMNDLGIDFNKSTLVKIDIEGLEMTALKGGIKHFKNENSPDLMIEFAKEHQENSGSSCAALYEYLENLGYKLFIYDYKNVTLKEALNKDYYVQNLIATKSKETFIERLQGNEF